MQEFRPFDLEGRPLEEQVRSWDELVQEPYDKLTVHPYTRCRVILMNGIENGATLFSHAAARLTQDEDCRRKLALVRRLDSQHQQLINWLNPGNATIVETTIGYEQVAVDLTANLAQNEPDEYFRQVLDFALLEDFDHLFRYGCLMELMEGKDPNEVTQGLTEIKPGRPTAEEHRHPFDEIRRQLDAKSAELKTKLNYHTIVNGEQQTMLFYKDHGQMYENPMARKLYTEIAEIEQQHVSQYEDCGDPSETALEKLTLMQLNEAYLYYSNAQTETDERFKRIWEQLCEEEIGHFQACAELLQTMEGRDIHEVLGSDVVPSLIVFEPNKEYVNQVLESQVDLRPQDKEFVPVQELPGDWLSFGYMEKVNGSQAPSTLVTEKAEELDGIPAVAMQTGPGKADIYERLKKDHEEVKGLFEKIIGGRGDRSGAWDKLSRELTAHARAEEHVFYEPLKEGDGALEAALLGYEEHHAADLFIKELSRNKPDSEQWMAKLQVLKELVLHHVVEEEGEIFQKAREVIDEERARMMVSEFQKLKKERMAA
ncbi:MAG: hemerythrin domain-containing protein [Actinobacteria bacterium]|nr:hemerythrin domain-containing protein [Actinomycetota bacterium]